MGDWCTDHNLDKNIKSTPDPDFAAVVAAAAARGLAAGIMGKFHKVEKNWKILLM